MNAAAAPAIDVRGLTKKFGARTVVDHFDLKVPTGAVYGFLGPNGSGKTTTIRMVCGLLKADAGEGTCLGFDVIRDSVKIKERVGYMTQRFSLYEDLSIRENLEFVIQLYAMNNQKKRVDDALEDLGLESRQKQLAGTLSGGWKQRLALAACMIHEPKLLLLDEPTAGVDPKARRDFWDQIHRFASEGVTTLVSTHYMDEAVQCDFIAYIAYGKKLLDAPTREIPQRVNLSAYAIEGADLSRITAEMKGMPGADVVARFGASLHVAGDDKAALDRAIAPYRNTPGVTVSPIQPGLEEVFIRLLAQSEENWK